jgi:hypothetical protein
MSNILHERARIAALTRSRQSDDPELGAATQNLKALRLERYVVDEAPALSAEQREHIAELLRGAGGAV